MPNDWKMCLKCDSSNASNLFTAQSNLWMSRAQGQSTWNPAGSGTPTGHASDSVYIEVTDAANSPVSGKMTGYLISSMKSTQTDVTPFRKNNDSSKGKLCVVSDKATKSGTTWLWGPYQFFQTGDFEFTFCASVDDPSGSELSDSWEEDPEFDIDP